MTSEELEDKYPHWKDALFGNNNAVANLRCAVHYVFWHGVYGLLAVFGLALYAVVSSVRFIGQYLGPLAAPIERGVQSLVAKINRVVNHPTTEMVFGGLFLVLAAAALLFAGWTLIQMILTDFWLFMEVLGIVLGAIALFIGLLIAVDFIKGPASRASSVVAVKARSAGEKATKTPGIRRVYGECPVSMDMAPHWFNKIFPEDEP